MSTPVPRPTRNRSPQGLRHARAFACPPSWTCSPQAFLADPPVPPGPSVPALVTIGTGTASAVVAALTDLWGLLAIPLVVGVFAAARGTSSRTADPRNFSDVVVLWSERGVPPQTMTRLREVERRLEETPDLSSLQQWWDVVGQAVAEQRAGGALPTLPPSPSTDGLAAQWALARQRHEAVTEAWTDLVCDPLSALTHCALFDVANPATAAFIEAKGRADDFTAVHGLDLPEHRARVDEYADLARSLETTWTSARVRAERAGFTWLPEGQRADAERASRLLALASSESAPLAERASAAERAASLLRRIHAVVLPDAALQALAALSRPELGGPGPGATA